MGQSRPRYEIHPREPSWGTRPPEQPSARPRLLQCPSPEGDARPSAAGAAASARSSGAGGTAASALRGGVRGPNLKGWRGAGGVTAWARSAPAGTGEREPEGQQFPQPNPGGVAGPAKPLRGGGPSWATRGAGWHARGPAGSLEK